jgi:anti-anti-sigma factor
LKEPGKSEREELRDTALPDFQNCEDSCAVPPAIELQKGIALSGSANSTVVRLSGSIDIASAAELKAALLKAFEAGKPIRVSIDGLSDLDVTALQLLWAAKQDAAKSGVEFAMDGKPPNAVGSLLTELGMEGLGLFD